MIPIALTFVIEALWLILSPWNLKVTITIAIIAFLLLGILTLYFFIKKYTLFTAILGFSVIGLVTSTLLYLPALRDYQIISLNLPLMISASFQIERNQYPSNSTIKLLKIDSIPFINQDFSEAQLQSALRNSTIRVFNIDPDLKARFIEGEIYQGKIAIRPRYFRNIPGDHQRILPALARQEIGYGKFEGNISLIQSASSVENFRQQTAHYFIENYRNGAYLSALSVGIAKYLESSDWDVLRKTGTIHLVSISGLHLSLTAFYAFIIFRISAGLLMIRTIPPYKIAAFLAIVVAWNYAIIAGLSLPTVRAAIMFSLAMFALLINRPIFSLHGVSIALIIILSLNPLSILLPGFWLSFTAVIILILSARIFSSPLKALLLMQLIISLLLIPLTASFFGEISVISPLTNLFAIPWTSIMIMPFLLLGTLSLFFHKPTAHLFLAIADQSVSVLTQSVYWSAKIPYASIETSRLPLFIAVSITFFALCLLYLYPRFSFYKTSSIVTYLSKIKVVFFKKYPRKKRYIRRLSFILLLTIGTGFLLFLTDHNQQKRTNTVNLYLLPVGEGLSLLFQSQELTFLYDTGSRFMRFDAGKQIILPTLRHLHIRNIDQIFLSLQNQQHTGGTRTIRTQYPNTKIISHPDLMWLIEDAQDCQQYHYSSEHIQMNPIPEIQSSCAFHLQLFNTISLYLISDISEYEWQYFIKKRSTANLKNSTHQILLFPNQGRRYYALDTFLKTENLHSTLLFSTKTISPKIEALFNNQISTYFYNAYYGAIHIQIDKKNAKPLSKLRIHNYADQTRYWWLNP